MKKHHDCQEVVNQFNMLLDGGLNPKEEQEVMCELHRCMHCLEAYNLEEKYRAFVKEKLEKKCTTTALIEKLKSCMK